MNDYLDSDRTHQDEFIGQVVLNKYRILKELARGGMGVVYLARLEGTEGFVKPVVVKRILPQLSSDSDYLGMFIREAQIMVNLKDRGVVSVLDFAEESGSYIMVLEYVRGYQLRQWFDYLISKERSIPIPVIVQIMINILDALHQVHTAKDHLGEPLNIVHRDICPSNVLIDTEGYTKIVDFGIGVIASSQHRSFKTQAHTRQFKGKLLYAAPELFENQPASPRTDVYAAAVMMHELIMGKNEFLADTDGGVIFRIVHHQPSHVYETCPAATLELDQAIQKGLNKDPEERYQTAAAFADALRKFYLTTERDAAEQLKEAVAEDFSEELAHYVGEETLAERDQFWASYRPGQVTARRHRPGDTQPHTHEPSTVVYAGLPSQRSKFTVPVLVGIVVVLGLGGWFLYNRALDKEIYIVSGHNSLTPARQSEPKRFIEDSPKVKPNKAVGVVESPVENREEDSPKAAVPKKVRVVKSPTPKSPPSPSSPQELGAVFSKKSSQMLRCMQQNLAEIPPDSKLKVRLHIASTGAVTKAEIQPLSLANTNVGRCIENVSKNAVFPPQGKALTIRIPINISLEAK